MSLENHYLATITVVIKSGKNHQWCKTEAMKVEERLLYALRVAIKKPLGNYTGG